MTFWNKVQHGVSRAAAEAEKQARTARINMQIGDVESTIREKMQLLGQTAFELIRAGQLAEPSLDSIVQEIGQQETRLAELRSELAEVQAAPAPTPS
jgi:hypothetical protein